MNAQVHNVFSFQVPRLTESLILKPKIAEERYTPPSSPKNTPKSQLLDIPLAMEGKALHRLIQEIKTFTDFARHFFCDRRRRAILAWR